MRTWSLSVLTVLLLGIGAPACSIGDIGELDIGAGPGMPGPVPTTLVFHGVVTSAPNGAPVFGVNVRIVAPGRGWTETAVTDSAGYYKANGLPNPSAGDCAGLSMEFSQEGFQPLRVIDFPSLTCQAGFGWLSVVLMPIG